MNRSTLLISTFAAICTLGCAQPKADIKPAGEHYTLEKTIEVAGRQGVACDGKFYYVSSSTALYKYTLEGELVQANENPFTQLELSANHFGDIDVYNGDIYTGIETFIDGVGQNIQIAVYSAKTLEYKYSIPWNADSGQVEVCGLAVDAAGGRVWMADWVQGTHLYCYDLTTHEYIGKTALSPAPGLQQGILCYKDRILISSDDGDASEDAPDHIYETTPNLGGTSEVHLWREMRDFLRAGEIEGLTVNPDTGEFIVLSNRGSRIVLGMVKGFYEGYDREIHELYVYRGPEAKLGKELFSVATKQGSFIADGYMVNLSNDGHAIAYRLPDGRDSLTFDLACAQFKPHCNVAQCIRKRGRNYAYVTEWNGERRLFVEDAAIKGGKYEGKLVQTITMDIPDSLSGFGYRDWVVDAERGRIYSFTYKGVEANNDRRGHGVVLLEFKLKSPLSGDICYTASDILRRAELPMICATQDKDIRNGKMYVTAGIKTKKEKTRTHPDRVRRIVVIDLDAMQIEKEYSLQFYNAEPEGFDWYDGRWIITFNRDKCYEVTL